MSAEHGDVWRSACGMMELRCGDYREALADVEPDHVITDPPYLGASSSGGGLSRDRYGQGCRNDGAMIPYAPASRALLASIVRHAPDSGWTVVFNDGPGAFVLREMFLSEGFRVGEPVGWVKPSTLIPPFGGALNVEKRIEWITVAARSGDGGRKPGAYTGFRCRPSGRSPDILIAGGKPLSLMRQVVRDYSRPGDLVCDPCAGGGTTLLAAAIEGRRAIGAELDPVTFAKAVKRLSKPYTPATLFRPGDTSGEQTGLDL